ncbi:hypothetical protein [Candidatus Phytoplasma meliae]|uniref:Uncharacterized protein n=1 Tax=Candidatus Phytoplasma meliae TaxID=1848402 RepID=A0ABS5CY54_9MOLU|nr:hypothetical protein [Candidatus Phytoplasma meliae]MBP5835901.1 hypothetical protein [Candidatus Phytoplasma meliae]
MKRIPKANKQKIIKKQKKMKKTIPKIKKKVTIQKKQQPTTPIKTTPKNIIPKPTSKIIVETKQKSWWSKFRDVLFKLAPFILILGLLGIGLYKVFPRVAEIIDEGFKGIKTAWNGASQPFTIIARYIKDFFQNNLNISEMVSKIIATVAIIAITFFIAVLLWAIPVLGPFLSLAVVALGVTGIVNFWQIKDEDTITSQGQSQEVIEKHFNKADIDRLPEGEEKEKLKKKYNEELEKELQKKKK